MPEHVGARPSPDPARPAAQAVGRAGGRVGRAAHGRTSSIARARAAHIAPTPIAGELAQSFPCFGGTCAIYVAGDGPRRTARAAADAGRSLLESWHRQFSRFEPDSELSRLNRDPRASVDVSPMMARFVRATVLAARLTGGLSDATLAEELVAAGYGADLPRAGLGLSEALRQAPARRPAAARAVPRWREIVVDLERHVVTRPPGVQLDSGGVAKGLFADALCASLAGRRSAAVDCGGDLRLGGDRPAPREIRVSNPFDDTVLYRFQLARGGVATSGIGRRSWMGSDGVPAHHLLDPATGRPAFTGIVQATALAPSAVEAEARAKAALLSGPRAAERWLPHGGVLVFDDGAHRVVAAAPHRLR